MITLRNIRCLRIAVLAPAVLAGACAHVSHDDLDASLASLRDDLTRQTREGDAAVRADLETRVDDLDQRMADLRADLQALEEEFGVRLQETEEALRFDVPVYFEFDDATLQTRGREVLNRFETVVSRHYPEAQLTVEGFADPAGSVDYNLRLGERRAEAVKNFLVGLGVPGERIRTVSYGEDVRRLIAPDSKGPGTAGWENRRVVIVIDHDGAASNVVASGERNP